MIPDPIMSVMTYLREQVDVIGLVPANRIWGEEVPGSDAVIKSMPSAGLVLVDAGGRELYGGSYNDFGGMRLSTRAYGKDTYNAKILDLAVYESLKRLNRWGKPNLGGLFWARQEAGPFTLRDPSTKWPYVQSNYRLLVGEVMNA